MHQLLQQDSTDNQRKSTHEVRTVVVVGIRKKIRGAVSVPMRVVKKVTVFINSIDRRFNSSGLCRVLHVQIEVGGKLKLFAVTVRPGLFISKTLSKGN